MENKGIYKTFEFKSWADRKGLAIEEEYLITRYLDVSGRTLEAGTGRILLALKERGFSSLYGFDYISEFIEHARGRDQLKSIRFDIQDASSLEYQDAFFHQSFSSTNDLIDRR